MASQDVIDKERALLPMHQAKGALFQTTDASPKKADEDAIWVAMKCPRPKLLPFERNVDPALRYREFELPSSGAATRSASRTTLYSKIIGFRFGRRLSLKGACDGSGRWTVDVSLGGLDPFRWTRWGWSTQPSP
ncbi:MAG: hypothetical protein ACRDPC_00130 [Solirubrobacteraceae bacterium]